MTQEEKQILLRDLCGRSLYGVKGLHRGKVHELFIIDSREVNSACIQVDGYDAWFPVETFKPYLRTMSSMTDREKEEYNNLKNQFVCRIQSGIGIHYVVDIDEDSFKLYDWLNAHHFDYRGLIPRGLALEAPEGMYKTE